MATKTRTRKPKSKPETNGTPEPEEDKVPGCLLGGESGRAKMKYSKHWNDYYWRHRVEAHETLVPIRELLSEFLCSLEDRGLIQLLDYDVVEHDEESSQEWEADKMAFSFHVLNKDGLPVVLDLPIITVTLAAEGNR